MSLPVRDDEQAIIAIVVLSLDVDFYNPAIPAEFLPDSSRFGYFRDDGIMVWRNVDPDGVIGTRPNAEAARRIVQTKDGEFESLAVDGVRRFFSVSPLPEYGLVAFVGVPSNTVFADARTRAYEAIALACAMIGLLLVLAGFFWAAHHPPDVGPGPCRQGGQEWRPGCQGADAGAGGIADRGQRVQPHAGSATT